MMVEKTVLDSGLVVISEKIPAFTSFTMSYSLRGGSRSENRFNNGINHLIEHMLFKGSKQYNQKEIAEVSDRLGGRMNAFTGKEVTQFYNKSIEEKLDESFSLLTDIVFGSIFPPDEFKKEKGVVIQEIKESRDDPDTEAFEGFYEKMFPSDPIGYPIAGNEAGIKKMDRDQVFCYYRDLYQPHNLVFAAVGGIDHQRLVDMAQSSFANYPKLSPGSFSFADPVFKNRMIIKKKPSLNQLYVIIGFEGISQISEDKYTFMVMNDILGAGMGSRLFQKIREEKGLAYTIHSFPDGFMECGMQFVYGIIEPAKLEDYFASVWKEIEMLKRNGISDRELSRSKDHIKASVILGLENNTSRMRFHVNNELYLGRAVDISEIVDSINQITVEDINSVSDRYLDLSRPSVLLYGKIEDSDIKKIREHVKNGTTKE